MDVLSHALWGGVAFGRGSRSRYWLAFLIGAAPDLCSFGVLSVAATLGLADHPDFSHGTPPESTIPLFVHRLYDVTHSLVLFSLVFFLAWRIAGRPLWMLGAWALHVLMDIPLHSAAFFPTPFLWPLFDWTFDGWPWMTPAVLIPNVLLLIAAYAVWYWRSIRRRRQSSAP